MTFRCYLVLLGLSWAALYLPALGDPELRGEEIRRILPAQGMLATGDWIVPRIAGEVYANKPPLINWAVAGMFALTGSDSETSARLVSALSMLALALAAFLLSRKDLGDDRACGIGLVLLTTLTLISKGRLIEIEALFTALTGIACFLWIRLWRDRRSPWLVWTLPYLFLGLGCLVKGPIHLLFWLPFVFATLWFARELRSLFHPAHGFGWLLMGMIFLPWVYLNVRAVGAGDQSVGNWIEELAVRGDVSRMEWGRWLTNPIRIPGGFLPWTIPLAYALWHFRRTKDAFRRGTHGDAVLAGSLCAVASGFVLVCLTPGGLPRYLMPVYPLAALATVSLFFRLPEATRMRYETFGLRFHRLLVPVLLVAPGILAQVASKRGESVSLLLVFAGLVATGFAGWLVLVRWKSRSVFLTTPILIAAGGLGLLPAMQPFQGDRDTFRKAALDIAGRVEAQDRIVVFADAEFRNRLTKHLRLLYYLREPIDGIGESGSVPSDTRLLLGRPEAASAMREILGRAPAQEETLTIRGIPLLVWSL